MQRCSARHGDSIYWTSQIEPSTRWPRPALRSQTSEPLRRRDDGAARLYCRDGSAVGCWHLRCRSMRNRCASKGRLCIRGAESPAGMPGIVRATIQANSSMRQTETRQMVACICPCLSCAAERARGGRDLDQSQRVPPRYRKEIFGTVLATGLGAHDYASARRSRDEQIPGALVGKVAAVVTKQIAHIGRQQLRLGRQLSA
jgi:hypothetical protein